MLTRKHRFHGPDALNFVYRHGTTARGQQLGLRYARNAQQPDYRVAVIVSRKVHKSAVMRNRLRRRIYEIVRTGPKITEPYDLVFTVFSDQVSKMDHVSLTQNITRLLHKAAAIGTSPRRTPRDIVKPEKG